MKTDDLVLMLATGAGVAPKHVAARRYTIALGWGMPISFALMLATIGLLSDIRGALALSGFWIKLGFVVTDRRFNRMRPSIAPRKRHQAG